MTSSESLTKTEQYLYRSVLTHKSLLPCGILAITKDTLATELTITPETFQEAFTTLTNLDLLDSWDNTVIAQEILHRPTPKTIELAAYPLIANTVATLTPRHPYIRLAQALHPTLFHPKESNNPTEEHTHQYLLLALRSAAAFKAQREPITTDNINALLRTYTTTNHYKTVDSFTTWISNAGKTKKITNVIDAYAAHIKNTQQHKPVASPPHTQSSSQTTMTASEWETIFHTITHFWPHAKLTKNTQQFYWKDLKRFPATHVQTAIESLYKDRENFPPNSAKITWRIAELLIDPPTWGEVKTFLTKTPTQTPPKEHSCRYNMCEGNGFIINEQENSAISCRCRKDHQNTLHHKKQALHPIITAFRKTYIAAGEIHELAEGNTTVEAQLRTKYEQFTHRIMRSIVYQGLQDRHQPGQLPGLDHILNLSKNVFSHNDPKRPTESLTNLLNQINPTPTQITLQEAFKTQTISSPSPSSQTATHTP